MLLCSWFKSATNKQMQQLNIIIIIWQSKSTCSLQNVWSPHSPAACTPEHLDTRFFSLRPTKQCWTVTLLSSVFKTQINQCPFKLDRICLLQIDTNLNNPGWSSVHSLQRWSNVWQTTLLSAAVTNKEGKASGRYLAQNRFWKTLFHKQSFR